ncbi:MAG: hypothetical protein WBH03_04805 [Cyclobacteriaceae bacterium]
MVDITYSFTLYEKCLAHLRNGQMHLGEYWTHKAIKEFEELPDTVSLSLSILYYPMLAYYHYVNGDPAEALRLLECEREAGYELFKDNRVLKTEFMAEQTINKLRIYCQTGDIDEAMGLVDDLLTYFQYGENRLFEMSFRELTDHDKAAAITWRNFVIDVILNKFMREPDLQPHLGNILDILAREEAYTGRLVRYVLAPAETADHLLTEELVNEPRFIQLLFLQRLRSTASDANTSDLINTYLIKDLKVDKTLCQDL